MKHWILPFPRLRFRLRHGYWCTHERRAEPTEIVAGEWTLEKKTVGAWEPGDRGRTDGWRMIDMGRRQLRRCSLCQYTELR